MLFQMIIIQVSAFAVIVFVMYRVFLKLSYNETNRLQRLNEESAQKTRELAAKISDAENEYREKMSKAEDEIRDMKSSAKKENEDLREAMIAKGKAEGDRIVIQALSSKEEIRAEIEEQMQEKCVSFSRRIFQKILGSEEQESVHNGLLESVFQELAKMEKDRLQAIDLGEMSGKAIEVKTPYPMSPAQKKKLEEVLSSKLGKTVTVQETVAKEIIAGIVITLGSFIIDGSLSERFKKAAEELK